MFYVKMLIFYQNMMCVVTLNNRFIDTDKGMLGAGHIPEHC